MSNVANKVTARDVAVATFNAALPYKDQLGNRAFRIAILAKLRSIFPYNSVPVMYNFAKKKAVNDGLCEDFSKSAGEAIGKRVEVDSAVENDMINAMTQAIKLVTENGAIQVKSTTTTAPKQPVKQPVEEAAPVAEMKWKLVRKDDGSVVDYAESRRKAYELRNGNEELTVKKVA